MTPSRTPTAVDAFAERYVEEIAALEPIAATQQGVDGHDAELTDYSPDGHAARAELRQRTLRALDEQPVADEIDRVTVAALREELSAEQALFDIGAPQSQVDNLASPVQTVRDVFDLMPTASTEDWAVIARRMAQVPRSLGGYAESLRASAAAGRIAPRRAIQAGVVQAGQNVGTDGFFGQFAASAGLGDAALPDALRRDLQAAAQAASTAYGELERTLRDDLLPGAPSEDAVGREQYAPRSRAFLGAQVDLAETYAWGQQQVAEIAAAMASTAERITPGATVREAMAHLDADPARQLHGTEALQAWMQERSDAAVAALAATHFDIPEPIRRLECRIAPTHSGGIYYTGPSEDLSRPGRMWWSVPEGVDTFATWGELTTVYHEGVPGHHLQIGQTAYRSELLNRWRRRWCWVSGHGEGWALYAERLMADLGFLDDPGDYLGMLDSQSLRAARVVIDIGVHCRFEAPAEVGGGAWTYAKAWAFLTAHCSRDEATLRFELARYLSWPGQAPSYKIGERIWLQLREDAAAAQGGAFDLKRFHRRALDIGSVGLDVLRAAVLGELADPGDSAR